MIGSGKNRVDRVTVNTHFFVGITYFSVLNSTDDFVSTIWFYLTGHRFRVRNIKGIRCIVPFLKTGKSLSVKPTDTPNHFDGMAHNDVSWFRIKYGDSFTKKEKVSLILQKIK